MVAIKYDGSDKDHEAVPGVPKMDKHGKVVEDEFKVAPSTAFRPLAVKKFGGLAFPAGVYVEVDGSTKDGALVVQKAKALKGVEVLEGKAAEKALAEQAKRAAPAGAQG